MTEHKRSERGIESESVHSVSRRVDHARRASVDNVPRGELLCARLQTGGRSILTGTHALGKGQDREDRSDANIDVDIGGPIEWIKHHDILSGTVTAVKRYRFFTLFEINVQGEEQQKLDVYADEALVHCLGVRENVAIIAYVTT